MNPSLHTSEKSELNDVRSLNVLLSFVRTQQKGPQLHKYVFLLCFGTMRFSFFFFAFARDQTISPDHHHLMGFSVVPLMGYSPEGTFNLYTINGKTFSYPSLLWVEMEVCLESSGTDELYSVLPLILQ